MFADRPAGAACGPRRAVAWTKLKAGLQRIHGEVIPSGREDAGGQERSGK